jgi:hypothetical protein
MPDEERLGGRRGSVDERSCCRQPEQPQPSPANAVSRIEHPTGNPNGTAELQGRGVRVEWGEYEPAVRRWEAIHGPAPEPLVRRMDDGDAKLRRVRARWTDPDCPHSATAFTSTSGAWSASTSSGSTSNEDCNVRREMSRTLENAKAVVEKAIEYGAWSWDDPRPRHRPDDHGDGRDRRQRPPCRPSQGSVNEAVLEILFADSIEPTSAPTREAYARRFNVTLGEPASNGHAEQPAAVTDQASHDAPGAPAQASAFGQPRPRTSVVGAAPPADSPTSRRLRDPPFDISDIFPGYDDYKAADIKKAIVLSSPTAPLARGVGAHQAYEVAHEDRKTIRELQPEFKAPEPEPQPEVQYANLARPADGAGRSPTSPSPSPTTSRSSRSTPARCRRARSRRACRSRTTPTPTSRRCRSTSPTSPTSS